MKRKLFIGLTLVIISLIAIVLADVFLAGIPLNADRFFHQVNGPSINPVTGGNVSGTINVSFELKSPDNLSLTNVTFIWQLLYNTSSGNSDNKNGTLDFALSNGSRVANTTLFNNSLSLGSTNDTLWNYTFDTTTIPDGLYNLTVMVVNNTGDGGMAGGTVAVTNFSFVINLTVDNTKPRVNITTPALVPTATIPTISGNEFDEMIFNATAQDYLSGVRNVIFEFTSNTTPFNRTGWKNNQSNNNVNNLTNISYWGTRVNKSSLTDGNPFTVTVYGTDYAGTINSTSTFTINVDRTAPTVTLSKSSSEQDQLVITISTASDASTCISNVGTVTGTQATQTITANGLTAETTYSFTVSCSDEVGNTGSVTTSFTTDAPSGGTAVSGGAAAGGAKAKPKVAVPTGATAGTGTGVATGPTAGEPGEVEEPAVAGEAAPAAGPAAVEARSNAAVVWTVVGVVVVLAGAAYLFLRKRP